jgi:hypothetical protein
MSVREAGRRSENLSGFGFKIHSLRFDELQSGENDNEWAHEKASLSEIAGF